MEDILNLNFHFDQFFELEQASEKDKYISIFQKLKNDFNYQLNVTEDDFKSIRIINNQKFEKIEEGYMALQNFAFVSQDIIKHFKANGFLLGCLLKCDVFIGNHNIIFENINKKKNINIVYNVLFMIIMIHLLMNI